jgi:hypothetical protein
MISQKSGAACKFFFLSKRASHITERKKTKAGRRRKQTQKQKSTMWYWGIARQGIHPAGVLHNNFRKLENEAV